MSALVTYCSRKKRRDKAPIHAIDRYVSVRIEKVWRRANAENRTMLILSGLLGLIRPDTLIRFYDKPLLPQDVGQMVDLVAHQLLWLKVGSVEYVTEDIWTEVQVRPYHDLLAAACKRERVKMVITDAP
jgi:pheromone shutdown protein TraB